MAALEPQQARTLKRILATVQKSVPDSRRVISYGIPAFRLDRVFIYCAAFKRHIGIYPPVRDDAGLRTALKPYANSKGNLAFPLEAPVPLALISRVAKVLAKQYVQASAARPASNGLYGNREAELLEIIGANGNRRFLKLESGHDVHMQRPAEVARFILENFRC